MTSTKVKWQTIVNVKSNVLTQSLGSLGLEKRCIKKVLDIDCGFEDQYYFDNTVAYSEKDLRTFFELVNKKLREDKDYYFTLPKKVEKLADNLLNFSRKIQRIKDFKKNSNVELEQLFSKFMEKAATAWTSININVPIEIIVTGELEKFVQAKLKEKGLTNKFEKYFQALTQRSSQETFFQKDYRFLLKTGAEIQKNKFLLNKVKSNSPIHLIKLFKNDHKILYNKLEKHHQKYSWINMSLFRRDPFTPEELMGRLKDILEKDCKKELGNLAKKRKATELAFNKALKDLEIKGLLKDKVEMFGVYVYLRTYRLDIFTLAAYLIRNLLLEISSRFKLSYDELGLMSLWEIKAVLLGKQNLSEIPIKKRLKNFAVIQVGGEFNVIVDEKSLTKLRQEKQQKTVKKVKIIKGKVASRGKATGPVKIVMHPTQVTKVVKGDVLVAPMTSPDFVMGMLKAVAIVTDHGGMTCHAAIVSRELGVPCIVGTGNATSLLEDGDIVEVDAEKGVIKRI